MVPRTDSMTAIKRKTYIWNKIKKHDPIGEGSLRRDIVYAIQTSEVPASSSDI